MPRSGTEYLFELLHELPHLIKCMTNPVNPSNQTMFKNPNKRSVIANYDDILKVYYSNV